MAHLGLRDKDYNSVASQCSTFELDLGSRGLGGELGSV